MAVSTFPLKTGFPGLNHIGTFTWAALVALTGVPTGAVASVSDLGYVQMVYNGTIWRPPSGSLMLGQSGVAVTHTGDTNETVLATVTVPAGLLGTNGGLRIYSSWTVTNSANNKVPRIRLGGVAGTTILSPTLTTTLTLSDIRRVYNRNSASSQVTNTNASTVASTGTTALAVTTAAVNMAVAQDLVFAGTLTLGSESISLEGYAVEALIP